MKNLRENGDITIDTDNRIHFTDSGKAIATRTYERHTLLTRLFIAMGVDADTAEADACKVEHDLFASTFDAIKKTCDTTPN